MPAKTHTINLAALRKGQDWHPFEIIVALRMKGTSLDRLGRLAGYHPKALHSVSHRTWPKGEAIIANAIGVAPESIWPSRYSDKSNKRRGQRDFSLRNSKISNADDTPLAQMRNVSAVDRAAA